MLLTKTIEIILSRPGGLNVVDAVEGDSYTRQVDIRLFADYRTPWTIPEGTEVMISYIKPDGTAGAYDTLPDGTQAYNINDSTLSVMLAPQMLTAVGMVKVQIRLSQGDKVLSTCPFEIRISRSIAPDAKSEDYFNWTHQYLPQTVGAQKGQWLRITEVDELGRVLAVEAVDAPEGGTSAGSDGAVQSVNGKTGAVSLTASDVGARPESWTPTAQEVGALPATYTPPNQTAQQVGADPAGTAVSAVGAHNVDTDAHNDLRSELRALADRINAALDSDDETMDQLSEIVMFIKSHEDLIQFVTTSKVNVADIINNLTTNVENKPLSAAQGVALKSLIDALSTGKLDSSKLTEAINTALTQAKESGEFDGDPGATPHIGANGNWWIGDTDTGVPAGISNLDELIQSSMPPANESDNGKYLRVVDGAPAWSTVINGEEVEF